MGRLRYWIQRGNWTEIEKCWPAIKAKLELQSIDEPRLVCDDETKIITLDGKTFKNLKPKQYLLFRTIQEGRGRPITRKEIAEKTDTFKGANAVAGTIRALPQALQACIISDTSGHAFRLPEKKKKNSS